MKVEAKKDQQAVPVIDIAVGSTFRIANGTGTVYLKLSSLRVNYCLIVPLETGIQREINVLTPVYPANFKAVEE